MPRSRHNVSPRWLAQMAADLGNEKAAQPEQRNLDSGFTQDAFFKHHGLLWCNMSRFYSHKGVRGKQLLDTGLKTAIVGCG